MQRWLRAGKALETGGISVSFGGFNPRPHTNVVGMWAFSNFFQKTFSNFFLLKIQNLFISRTLSKVTLIA
jgi:hypothetical protein